MSRDTNAPEPTMAELIARSRQAKQEAAQARASAASRVEKIAQLGTQETKLQNDLKISQDQREKVFQKIDETDKKLEEWMNSPKNGYAQDFAKAREQNNQPSRNNVQPGATKPSNVNKHTKSCIIL